jgi:hypothetical protein
MVGRVRRLEGDEFLVLLGSTAEPSLEAAFGPALRRVTAWKYATNPDEGHLRAPGWLAATTRLVTGFS